MTLNIKGKVQKVGFRYSVVDHVHAQQLAIVGHVRNLADGSVEVIAQGELDALRELHRFCTKGPSMAEVREVSEEIKPIKKYDFSAFNLLPE